MCKSYGLFALKFFACSIVRKHQPAGELNVAGVVDRINLILSLQSMRHDLKLEWTHRAE